MAAKCRVCGNFRHPNEFVIDTVVGYCWHCYERNNRTLAMLGDISKVECCECGVSPSDVPADLRMRLYDKDGVKQLLCVPCGDDYERKQRGMFANTPYGQQKGLHIKT
jgi:hypothetical protein